MSVRHPPSSDFGAVDDRGQAMADGKMANGQLRCRAGAYGVQRVVEIKPASRFGGEN